MRKVLALFIVGAGLLAVAGAAGAQTVNILWDICGPFNAANVNKNFTTPGIYKQVISGTNFGGMYRGQQVDVTIATPGGTPQNPGPYPSAWKFEGTGCNAGQVTFSTIGLTKACPKLEGTNPLPLTSFIFDYATDAAPSGHYKAANAFDTFTGIAATRYTLWQVNFDHSFSAAGPQDTTIACGDVDRAMCIVLRDVLYLNELDQTFTATKDNIYLTWNDATNPGGECPATPTKPVTWGLIKNQYRR